MHDLLLGHALVREGFFSKKIRIKRGSDFCKSLDETSRTLSSVVLLLTLIGHNTVFIRFRFNYDTITK